jgi:hypothetical protein
MQKLFTPDDPQKRSIHIYFGKCPDKRFEAIGSRLFKFFPTPFLRADFGYYSNWQLTNVSPMAVKEIPKEDRAFAQAVASEYFAGKKLYIPKRSVSRYDLAILHDPAEQRPPSDAKALKRFVKAADELGIGTELITREDSNRLSEFDALFIRETTNVDHHTYRLARKAVAEGLVVIDDPESILRCSNKVYLAELLGRARIPIPKTYIVHNRNMDQLMDEMSYPCILKQPDSAFSQGVVRVENREELLEQLKAAVQEIGVGDRPGVPAIRVRLAHRHSGPQTAVRLQVLHGRQPLADRAQGQGGAGGVRQGGNPAGGQGAHRGGQDRPQGRQSHR